MKKKALLLTLVLVMAVSDSVQASLVISGEGTIAGGTLSYQIGYKVPLIHDTELGITWLGFTTDRQNLVEQVAWADHLEVFFGGQTYKEWRLSGIDELRHLYYESLAGTPGSDTSPLGLDGTLYWSGTVSADVPGWAWVFGGHNGYQGLMKIENSAVYPVMAVMDGNVAPVPIHAAVWLLGSGLVGIIGFKKLKGNRRA